MRFLPVLLTLLGYACAASVLVPGTTLLRTPEHDSAVIQSARLNGNFAYSTMENHAYKAITPLIAFGAQPVAVHYQPILYVP